MKILNTGSTGVVVGRVPHERDPKHFSQVMIDLCGGQITQVPEVVYQEKLASATNIILLSEKDAKTLLDKAHARKCSPAEAWLIDKMEAEQKAAQAKSKPVEPGKEK